MQTIIKQFLITSVYVLLLKINNQKTEKLVKKNHYPTTLRENTLYPHHTPIDRLFSYTKQNNYYLTYLIYSNV